METLKMKIGPHEFEATGSPESVREKLAAFKELVGMLSNTTVQQLADTNKKVHGVLTNAVTTNDQLTKIMRVNGREISLTARPQQLNDAILLLIFGQKTLRENDAVTGAELIAGLNTTGGYSFNRIDGMLEKMARDGDVIVVGEHRSKTYRLTNTGLAKARQLAADLLAIVA